MLDVGPGADADDDEDAEAQAEAYAAVDAESFALAEAEVELADWQRLRHSLLQRAQKSVALLDDLSEAEAIDALPSDSALSDGPCLSTLLTETAAVRQEMRLQRRELSKLREQTTQLSGAQTEALSLAKATLRNNDAAKQRQTQDVVKPFLDVRDALVRSLKQPAPALPPPSFWQRLLQRLSLFRQLPEPKFTQAEMLIQQMDRALAQSGVEALNVVGCQFDPEQMLAVAAVEATGTKAGVVVEQVVGGFLFESRLWKLAHVVVSK